MNRKHIFRTCRMLLLAMLAVPTAVMAADSETYDKQFLVINAAGGTQVSIALEDVPVLSVSNDSLVVTSLGDNLIVPFSGTTYAIETRKVEKPSHTTGISNIIAPNSKSAQPQFSLGNGTVSGLKAGAKVTIYQIGGQAVKTISADNEGKAELNITNLPAGIYIIKTPTQSFKIINR